MSHLPLRSEKNCLNCGAEVEERFCPKCGQENVEVRPKFHHLISHFFADLFHYDSGFWKTMKTLLFRPGVIVNDYLSGKRKTYVEPVKLYIFVSFVAFFLPSMLPDFSEKEKEKERKFELQKPVEKFEGIEVAGFKNIKTVQQLDSLQTILPDDKKIEITEYTIMRKTLEMINNSNVELQDDGTFEMDIENFKNFKISNKEGLTLGKNYQNIKTLKQFDSIHNALPEDKKMNWLTKKFSRKAIEIQEREAISKEHLGEKFIEIFLKNLPKALFIYLPFFAFSLWLIHGKRKWLYYDHGIFTLYFFSALLIIITLLNINSSFLSIPYLLTNRLETVTNLLEVLMAVISISYVIFYFFRAHHRVYNENAWISRLKCILLLFVNTILLSIILTGYTLITFLTL